VTRHASSELKDGAVNPVLRERFGEPVDRESAKPVTK
jgi:hypothetical protein